MNDPTLDYNVDILYIKDNMSFAAIYEQLAEEATELAHASLKMARILRNENPTPLSLDEARSNLIEEYSDVMVVGNVMRLNPSFDIMFNKVNRWKKRLENNVSRKDSTNVNNGSKL